MSGSRLTEVSLCTVVQEASRFFNRDIIINLVESEETLRLCETDQTT